MRHTFECHSSEPNFKFPCQYCQQTFTNLSSIDSHLSRKHKIGSGDSSVTVPESTSEDVDDPFTSQLNDLTPDLHSQLQDISAPLSEAIESVAVDNHYLTQKSAALFLLTLKERYKLTQTAINFAVTQVQNMVSFAFEDIKEHLREVFVEHNLGE